MIVVDTHIWVWWTAGSDRLSSSQLEVLRRGEQDGIGVSAISCWEIAKLVALGRLHLDRPVDEWLQQALDYQGVRLLELTPKIAAVSASLPGTIHRDPADQMIVATAMVHQCPLVTSDARLIAYEHIETIS